MGLYGNRIAFDVKKLVQIKRYIADPTKKIMLFALFEQWPIDQINNILELFDIAYDQSNVFLVLDIISITADPTAVKIKNVITYDGLRVISDKVEKNSVMSLDTGKFLYLTGKPYKAHRIRTLYQMYKQKMLDKCEWSLFYSQDFHEVTRVLLPELSDSEYNKFIEDCERSVDEATIVSTPNILNVMDVFNYDHSLFQKTSLSLVTETFCVAKNHYMITEKTWKPITNLQAFVLIGYKESYDWLEKGGIDTFQYAMKHKKEAFSGEVDDIIRLSIENVNYFLENMHLHRDRIIQSILHNKKIHNQMIAHYRSIVDESIEPFLKTFNSSVIELKGEDAIRVIDKLWCRLEDSNH